MEGGTVKTELRPRSYKKNNGPGTGFFDQIRFFRSKNQQILDHQTLSNLGFNNFLHPCWKTNENNTSPPKPMLQMSYHFWLSFQGDSHVTFQADSHIKSWVSSIFKVSHVTSVLDPWQIALFPWRVAKRIPGFFGAECGGLSHSCLQMAMLQILRWQGLSS